MLEIIPGILEKAPEEIEKKLQILKPITRSVHVDILDGKFSEEISCLETEFFKKYKDDFFMEAHLMVDNPLNFLQKYADVGFKRFLGHIEKMGEVEEFVARGQILGEVGIAFDIGTKIEDLKIPFDDLDSVLIMSVKAGKSGQNFLPDVLEKVKKIKEEAQIIVEIDGGINEQTLIMAKNAGAERFVANSCIFNSQDPLLTFEKLSAGL